MVKRLRICVKCIRVTMLTVLLLFIVTMGWLSQAERSLDFLKPWILSALNPTNAAVKIDFDEVTVDWRNLMELGKIHITRVTFANPKTGASFAQLPTIYATIDPFGFLPHRHLINKVILREPHLFLTYTKDNVWKVGVENSGSAVAFDALFPKPAEGEPVATASAPLSMPFRAFFIDHAAIDVYDEKHDAHVLSQDLSFLATRASGRYHVRLALSVAFGERLGNFAATIEPRNGSNDYVLDAMADRFPAAWICTFAAFGDCPEKTSAEGDLGLHARAFLGANGSTGDLWGKLITHDFRLTLPGWFAEPLAFKPSSLTVSYDVAAHKASLLDSALVLADTTINATATSVQKEDGWYTDISGKASDLPVTALYKYWPVALAPDSRLWVTSKLKAGHASGQAQIHMTPREKIGEDLPDAALSSDVIAQDITVDYLPGFPELSHVNGNVHFTGATVKVDAKGGTMLSGVTVNKSTLLCPDLHNPKTPMEVTVDLNAPMKDVATLLALQSFTFDDAAGLDPKTIQGSAHADLKLKFNAFSESKSGNPNELHLDAVDYAIKAELQDVAQNGMFGGYNIKALNGTLAADVKSTSFDGSLAVGDAGISDVKLAAREGGPTTAEVKSRSVAPVAAATPVPQSTTPAPANSAKAASDSPGNDFTLTYSGGTIPKVTVKGKRLDASVSYGNSDHSLLKNFPALDLSVALDTLYLAPGSPFRDLKGALYCTPVRCESAHFQAVTGKGKMLADITRLGGVRQLMLSASDAGEFLKALSITDRVTRGKLDLKGAYDDARTPIPFNGKLHIDEFTLQNSQILGRILSIGSLTGLSNALTGSGILFNKLTADVGQKAGVVSVAQGRANGNAMGITFGGTVDTNTTKLRLKGVVVPAYALNSMLGNIPIIGALAGGEGEGLIAFNYSVTGTYADPDVNVNPLSGLTPGFLRGVFGIFDQSPKTSAPEEGDKTTPSAPTASPHGPGVTKRSTNRR